MSVYEMIPGGKEVVQWFGREPSFHDAYIQRIEFSTNGTGVISIYGWNMTNRVDERGYFISEKHALVTLCLSGVEVINIEEFDRTAIIFELGIEKTNSYFELKWESSYGACGRILTREMRMEITPGEILEM